MSMDDSSAIDDILSRNERTTVRSTSLTCENYTLFSCPKEILDIFARAANIMIAGGHVPGTFITPSLLSDMNLKSRLTAIKKNSFFGISALLVMATTFPFFYLQETRAAALVLFFAVFTIGFLYVGGYGYWYGRIEGMRVDDDLSEKIDENSSRVFRSTTVFVIFSKAAVMYAALFFLYLNTPQIFYAMEHVLKKNAIATLVKRATSPSSYNEMIQALHRLEGMDWSGLPYLFLSETLFYAVGTWVVIHYGMKLGRRESEKESRETHRRYAEKQQYTIEKALKLLKDKEEER